MRRFPLTPLCAPRPRDCDRMGFISVLVKPLYAEWRKLLGDDLQTAVELLQQSFDGWEKDGNAICADWEL